MVNVPDDAVGRRVFSRISRFLHPFIRTVLHTHLASPSSRCSHTEDVPGCGRISPWTRSERRVLTAWRQLLGAKQPVIRTNQFFDRTQALPWTPAGHPLLATARLRRCGSQVKTSIPGRVTPGFAHFGIVTDDAVGRREFSGISRFPRPCIPALLHSGLISPSSALNTSRSLKSSWPREGAKTAGGTASRRASSMLYYLEPNFTVALSELSPAMLPYVEPHWTGQAEPNCADAAAHRYWVGRRSAKVRCRQEALARTHEARPQGRVKGDRALHNRFPAGVSRGDGTGAPSGCRPAQRLEEGNIPVVGRRPNMGRAVAGPDCTPLTQVVGKGGVCPALRNCPGSAVLTVTNPASSTSPFCDGVVADGAARALCVRPLASLRRLSIVFACPCGGNTIHSAWRDVHLSALSKITVAHYCCPSHLRCANRVECRRRTQTVYRLVTVEQTPIIHASKMASLASNMSGRHWPINACSVLPSRQAAYRSQSDTRAVPSASRSQPVPHVAIQGAAIFSLTDDQAAATVRISHPQHGHCRQRLRCDVLIPRATYMHVWRVLLSLWISSAAECQEFVSGAAQAFLTGNAPEDSRGGKLHCLRLFSLPGFSQTVDSSDNTATRHIARLPPTPPPPHISYSFSLSFRHVKLLLIKTPQPLGSALPTRQLTIPSRQHCFNDHLVRYRLHLATAVLGSFSSPLCFASHSPDSYEAFAAVIPLPHVLTLLATQLYVAVTLVSLPSKVVALSRRELRRARGRTRRHAAPPEKEQILENILPDNAKQRDSLKQPRPFKT
ncbi:hypothetical protein PR048_005064 [Dryococelus australis]|uniref:Uncharacterized protein n=1 Tax=Dryococelus australis TaxID=614101 RepID=A0ABQ9I763_9NEOP|nr:hypothetical protein PR048_005064 [Dryococelus australis]